MKTLLVEVIRVKKNQKRVYHEATVVSRSYYLTKCGHLLSRARARTSKVKYLEAGTSMCRYCLQNGGWNKLKR